MRDTHLCCQRVRVQWSSTSEGNKSKLPRIVTSLDRYQANRLCHPRIDDIKHAHRGLVNIYSERTSTPRANCPLSSRHIKGHVSTEKIGRT